MSRFYEALRAMQTVSPTERRPTAENSGPVTTADVRLEEREGPTATTVAVPLAPAHDNGYSSAPPETPVEATAKVKVRPTMRIIPYATSAAVMEQYRRLRTKMLQQREAEPFRSVLIASPGPKEGKTLTTLNLAISFSMLPEFRVLMIDGDLRRHELSNALDVAQQPGFGNLLDGSAQLDQVTQPLADFPMFVIGAGNSATPPAELLHSSRLPLVMQQISQQFDLIFVDSPPVNLVTDTQLLGRYTDAVLVVARAFSTGRKALEKTAQDLKTFRVIGSVLNGGVRAQPYGRKNVYY